MLNMTIGSIKHQNRKSTRLAAANSKSYTMPTLRPIRIVHGDDFISLEDLVVFRPESVLALSSVPPAYAST